jgi:hypothetical protein
MKIDTKFFYYTGIFNLIYVHVKAHITYNLVTVIIQSFGASV